MSLGPVNAQQLAAATLHVAAEGPRTLDRVFAGAYPLVGPLDECDVGGHGLVPAFAQYTLPTQTAGTAP